MFGQVEGGLGGGAVEVAVGIGEVELVLCAGASGEIA